MHYSLLGLSSTVGMAQGSLGIAPRRERLRKSWYAMVLPQLGTQYPISWSTQPHRGLSYKKVRFKCIKVLVIVM